MIVIVVAYEIRVLSSLEASMTPGTVELSSPLTLLFLLLTKLFEILASGFHNGRKEYVLIAIPSCFRERRQSSISVLCEGQTSNESQKDDTQVITTQSFHHFPINDGIDESIFTSLEGAKTSALAALQNELQLYTPRIPPHNIE